VRRDFATSPEMRKVVKDVSTSSGELQKLFTQVNAAMPAISQLSQDLGGVMPQLSKTLGETVFTLQAMQRSFILRGAVADLKKEEKQNGGRLPASVPETTVESIFPQAHPRR